MSISKFNRIKYQQYRKLSIGRHLKITIKILHTILFQNTTLYMIIEYLLLRKSLYFKGNINACTKIKLFAFLIQLASFHELEYIFQFNLLEFWNPHNPSLLTINGPLIFKVICGNCPCNQTLLNQLDVLFSLL